MSKGRPLPPAHRRCLAGNSLAHRTRYAWDRCRGRCCALRSNIKSVTVVRYFALLGREMKVELVRVVFRAHLAQLLVQRVRSMPTCAKGFYGKLLIGIVVGVLAHV